MWGQPPSAVQPRMIQRAIARRFRRLSMVEERRFSAAKRT